MRGFTWTGYQEGYITAEVHHDWTQKSSAEGSDLITAVSKKAAVPPCAWDIIDLEPECTLFSTANTQIVSRTGRRNEKTQKAAKNALEEELIREMYRMIL